MANVPDDSKEYFTQSELPPPEEPAINIVPSPTGSQVVDGSLRSPNYRTGQSGWTINSDGTAEFIGLEATNVRTTQTFPASESMSAGTPVGVDWLGQISRAMRNFQDDATNQPTITATSYGGILGVYPVSQNNFVVIYEQTISTTDYFKAVIATLDSSTNDLSFGTPTTLTQFNANFYATADTCQVDTDTFVLLVATEVGTENLYGLAFTVSGTTISSGSATVLSTNDNLDDVRCCKADTLKYAFCAGRDGFTNTIHGFGTVSGTTIGVSDSSTTDITNITDPLTKDMQMAQIGTDKVVILQGSNGYAVVCTTSGSWSVGTAVNLFSTTGGWTTSSIVSPASDTFYAHLGTKSGYFTVSGTTPTLQGSLVTRTGSEGGMIIHQGAVYDIQTNPTDDQNAGIWAVTQSGSSATLTQISSNLKKDGVYFKHIASDGYRILAISTTDLSYWTSSMSYNFIGILQNATSRDTYGKVTIRGVDSSQTGLVSGSYYLVTNGTLSRISPIETVNTLDDVVNVVKAISSTQILV